ncbi:MAG: adenine deaminase [Mobilitalea sp.]
MINHNIEVAKGACKADLVLKNATVINVFTEAMEQGDIAITNGIIVGIGQYEGEKEIDCTNQYVAPGFMDGHIHLESSMLRPVEFAKAVLPHGTTAVITDPHEIANVCGMDGIEYMMESTKGLPLDVFFVLPSCVPATAFDENGYVLKAKDLEVLYKQDIVLGLAEVMDYFGTIRGDSEILDKIADAKAYNKIVDGHAPGLSGKDLCAYITAGVQSDHECVDMEEALEKLKLGQWVMIREGTAARNLNALMGLFEPPYHQRAILVTDDKHPSDIISNGHIDDILRKAIQNGADPVKAIKMATYNTAVYFGIKNTGAIAPGYKADIVILSDLKKMIVQKVIKNGNIVVDGAIITPIDTPRIKEELVEKVHHSFHCSETTPEDFLIKYIEKDEKSESFRVIRFVPGEIFTKEAIVPLINGKPRISVEEDIIKLSLIERHHNTNHIGLGFVTGYGLKKGAIASSVSHDSHNIVVIGTNNIDMSAAANCIREMQGGWAIACEGKIIGQLALPIGGLISELDAPTLANQMKDMKIIARELGVSEGIDPFMTLAFVSLPVIPELRLITTGLFDARHQHLSSITL